MSWAQLPAEIRERILDHVFAPRLEACDHPSQYGPVSQWTLWSGRHDSRHDSGQPCRPRVPQHCRNSKLALVDRTWASMVSFPVPGYSVLGPDLASHLGRSAHLAPRQLADGRPSRPSAVPALHPPSSPRSCSRAHVGPTASPSAGQVDVATHDLATDLCTRTCRALVHRIRVRHVRRRL